MQAQPDRRMRGYLIAVPALLTIHNLEEVVGGMGASREALRGPCALPVRRSPILVDQHV